MHLDITTLMFAGSLVTAISSILLVFTWWQRPESTGALWWAGANFVLAGGIILYAQPGFGHSLGASVLALVLLNLAPGLTWKAARLLNGDEAPLVLVIAAPVLGLGLGAAGLIPGQHQMAVSLGVTAAYTLAAAWEFWRKRSERLRARWPLIVLISIHAALFFAGMLEAATGVISFDGPAPLTTWFGLIHVEVLFYVIGTAIFVSAITRERAELDLRAAAEIDVLTGVASRRSFMDRTRGMLTQCLDRDDPLCFILFDLDRFKQINDTYGHATGDEMLQIFSESVRRHAAQRRSRRTDRRRGIRCRAARSRAKAPPMSSPTASGSPSRGPRRPPAASPRPSAPGVSTAHLGSTLDSLISSADDALYRAKAKGRDRVEIAAREPRQPDLRSVQRGQDRLRWSRRSAFSSPMAASMSCLASSESHSAGPSTTPIRQPLRSIRIVVGSPKTRPRPLSLPTRLDVGIGIEGEAASRRSDRERPWRGPGC